MSEIELPDNAIKQATSRSAPGIARSAALPLLGILLIVLAGHAAGVLLDCVASIRYPGGLDYGEGIVWQQALLIPGPRMYSASPDLPCVVFHYPPLFYLLVNLAGIFTPTLLEAGRLISALSAIAIAAAVAGLVFAATPSTERAERATRLGCAVAAGLLAFCVHAVRSWALVMRVDMLAVALGLAGVLLAARADGRWRGTTCGLLLCVAAVYTKQTELPAGIAVFVIAMLRNPRAALGAGCVALVAGLVPLVALQWLTHGGFLQNIIEYNINRFDFTNGTMTLQMESASLPLAVVVALAVVYLLIRGIGLRYRGDAGSRVATTRAMLLLHLVLSTLMLSAIFKSGGSNNYFVEWLCVGCALAGVLMFDAITRTRVAYVLLAALCLYSLASHLRFLPDRVNEAEQPQQAALVRRIREADKPVASDDMVLLMRAGKPVIFEPAIVAELTATGRWDERPLVDMIASGEFAFMLTADDQTERTSLRSVAMDNAMQRAYPRIEQVGPALWIRLPRE